ncbi:MAG TPA: hypothetical protein VFE16_12885 [Candidatus Cybelea sp.]|nr:hypothetical protein [Candidatus Cybelea sp.]
MKRWSFTRRMFGVCAAAVTLAACGGSQMQNGMLSPDIAQAPHGAPGDGLGSANAMAHSSSRKGRSWMDPAAASRTLIYGAGDVSSYVFTTGGQVIGNIAEIALSTCSDRNGDVFFNKVNSIVEYAHGGTTPIASYGVPGTAYSCSVDPTTGDLAAVVFCESGCGDSVVVLSTPGKKILSYSDSALPSLLYCAYDSSGNLYVDGYSGSQFGLAELPASGTALATITVNQNIQFAGQIQWDGQYLAVTTIIHPAVDQIQVTGSTATVVNTTELKGVGPRSTQSWIYRNKIAVPTGVVRARSTEILFWKYPQGGSPVRVFTHFIGKGHAEITGVTVSEPPKKQR